MQLNGRDVDLVALCTAVNAKEHKISEVEVALAEEAAANLRRMRLDHWPEETVPPADIAKDLSHIGWLIYVTSWEILQTLATDWSRLTGEEFDEACRLMELLKRVDDAARKLPWPEYAPRALGAYRTHALGLSKEDTPKSYREAWSIHQKADRMYEIFRLKVQEDSVLTRALDEIQVQLQLAETGTSCREPEQVITAWHAAEAGDEEDTFLRLFRGLEIGTVHGADSIAMLKDLDERRKLGQVVDEVNLLTRSNFRNPGIMTARAHLIMLPMTAVMQAWDQPPLHGHNTWDDVRRHLLTQAYEAYATIEQEQDEVFRPDHTRQVVQLRLMLAILGDGRELATQIMELNHLPTTLDAAAVHDLSEWLAARNHDAGIISSAMMPAYLAGLRLLVGNDRWLHYVGWRRAQVELDRQVRSSEAAARATMARRRLNEFDDAVIRSMSVI